MSQDDEITDKITQALLEVATVNALGMIMFSEYYHIITSSAAVALLKQKELNSHLFKPYATV